MTNRRSQTRPAARRAQALLLGCALGVLLCAGAARAAGSAAGAGPSAPAAATGTATGGEDSQGARSSDPCLTDPVCRGYYNDARQAYKEKRYEVALKGYQAAYSQRQAPWLLFNIGRSYPRLGQLQDALDAYERYQAADPNPDPATLARVKEYATQVRAGLGKPAPSVAPAGSEIEPPPAPLVEKKPVYKKAWFWVVIAGVAVAAGAGIGAGVYFATRPTPEPPVQMKLPNPEPPTGVMVFEPMF